MMSSSVENNNYSNPPLATADEAGANSQPLLASPPSKSPPVSPPSVKRIQSLRKAFFWVAGLAYSLNAVTLWRLPYLYARHGVAFLVPLTLGAIFVTCPLLCCELFVGQLVWSQSYLAWPKLHPALCGLGLSAFIFMLYVTIYASTPAAWSLAIAWHSFSRLIGAPFLLSRPPVTSSEGAAATNKNNNNNSSVEPPWIRRPDDDGSDSLALLPGAAIDFVHSGVLESVGRIEAMANLRNYFVCEVLAAMIAFWLVVFLLLLLRRHIHKFAIVLTWCLLLSLVAAVVLSTVMAPAQQRSFVVGMQRLLRWHGLAKLVSPQMWLDGLGQSLLAVGAISGFVWVNGAHLRLRNDFKRDAFVLTAHHLVSSLFGLLLVYAGLGAFKLDDDDNSDDVAKLIGPTMPAVALLGLVSNWTKRSAVTYSLAVVVFTLLALVQACCHALNVITAVNVLSHSRLPAPLRNNGFAAAGVCLFLAVFSHPLTTSTGSYLLQGLDDYVLPFVTLALAVAELFLFAWVYSWPRIRTATTRAIGSPPSLAWAVLWRFVAPCFVCFVLGAGVVIRVLEPPRYVAYVSAAQDDQDDAMGKIVDRAYPRQMVWMDAVLIGLALLPIVILPLLRQCGVVIFPYAPLRTDYDRAASASLLNGSAGSGGGGSGGSVSFWDRYNFPWIDASLDEIMAWEHEQREQIMYETLHQASPKQRSQGGRGPFATSSSSSSTPSATPPLPPSKVAV